MKVEEGNILQFINCTYEEHAASILDIFNDAILHSTALYDYEPRAMENMVSWFHIKTENNFPVIGVIGVIGDQG